MPSIQTGPQTGAWLPDIGLERIVADLDRAAMPMDRMPIAIDTPVPQHVTAEVRTPNFDDRLIDLVRPTIQTRELFTRPGYMGAFEAARATIGTAAADDPALGRLARLLEAAAESFRFIDANQKALLRG